MRSFLAAYEAAQDYLLVPPSSAHTDAWNALQAKKEDALRGWIVYCALCGFHDGLTLDFMRLRFGEWVNRLPTIELRGETYVLTS